MSLTDSPDPRKTARYPRFTDWPRLPTPGCRFPLDEGDNLALTAAAEEESLGRLRRVLEDAPHEVAGILIEPIQGEGGDAHFRPEFLRGLRTLADEHEALLIFDEVQTGFGLTGQWWAYEGLGVKPDLVCFGKKFQVCGFLASERVDEVDSVFTVPSRISSTFEGNIVDMVRCTEVLRTVERDGLLEHVRIQGAWLLGQLEALAERHEAVTGPRAQGLMAAFDLPNTEARDAVLERCFGEGLIILGCGDRSLRFRPSLDVSRDDLSEALGIIERCLP
jgi:L-lysine 6-transaminase